MANDEPKPDDVRMSFGEHLEELRKYVVRGLIGVGVIAVFTMIYGRSIIAWLVEPLTRVQELAGLPKGVITTSVTAGFSVYIKVSVISALILGVPWIIYNIWKFVEQGLYPGERRVVKTLAPFSFIMTLLGVLFMYYILLPVCLTFLVFFATTYPDAESQGPGFMDVLTKMVTRFTPGTDDKVIDPGPDNDETPQQPVFSDGKLFIPVVPADPETPKHGQLWFAEDSQTLRMFIRTSKDVAENKPGRVVVYQQAPTSVLRPLIDIDSYIRFVMFLTIGIVIGFQLPVMMTIIGWSKIIDPKKLAAARKYCVFICFVSGALLTPADPISMFVLAVPLWLLFEFGLVLMKRTYGTGPEPWDDEDAEETPATE